MATHHVGIGQVVVSTDPSDRIDMLGLGSCVGIYLVSPGKFVAAAHALLDRAEGRNPETPGKFVDTAVPHLLGLARQHGFAPSSLRANIAGGAQIFAFSGGRPELEIGARNAATARELLAAQRLRLDVDHTGGTSPRRASMVVGEGRLVVTAQGGLRSAA